MALNFLKRFDKYLKEKGTKQKYISWISRKQISRKLMDCLIWFEQPLDKFIKIWYNTVERRL
jgi:hypothetical protein